MNNLKNTAANVSRTGTTDSRPRDTSNESRGLRRALSRPLSLAGIFLASCIPFLVEAAETAIQENIDTARNTLLELDNLAETCLQVNEPNIETEDDDPCGTFIDAINEDLLTQYLGSCAAAKSWRDQFVTVQMANPDSDPSTDTDDNLELLVSVEFFCGEDALIKRTAFVDRAYQHLRQIGPTGSISSSTTYAKLLNEIRQQSTMDRERELLLDSMQRVQQRQLQETNRQFDKLELELIRQNQQ